nr:FkbM family methyltransferase [uncultured Roseococcus sp.]
MITREDVISAYMSILGRVPESEAVIAAGQEAASLTALGQRLLEGEEFRARMAVDVFARSKWVCAEIRDGLKLWLDLADHGVSLGCLRGGWEPAETDFVLAVLEAGDCFVDVGANIGWFSVLAAQAVGPGGRVYSFEPREDLSRRLRQSIADNGFDERCRIETVALGAEEGSIELAWVPDERNPGHSFFVPGALPEGAASLGRVPVRPLDALGIEGPVRLIKIDVEGAEPLVLRGAQSLIGRDRPILLFEIFPEWLRRVSGTTADALLTQLRGWGYRLFCLGESGIGRELHSGDDGSQPGGPAYYQVIALSEADCRRYLSLRLDHRVSGLEERLRREGEIFAAAQAEAAIRLSALRAEADAAIATVEATATARLEAQRAEYAASIAQARAQAEASATARLEAQRAECAASIAQARAQAEAGVAARLEAQRAECMTTIAQARARAEAEVMTRLAALRAETSAAIADARAAADHGAQQELQSSLERLQAIEASTLWRAANPIRRAGHYVPSGLRRALSRGVKLAWWSVSLQLPDRLRQYRNAKAQTNGSDTTAIASPEGPQQLVAAVTTTGKVPEQPGKPSDWRPSFVEPVTIAGKVPTCLPLPTKPRALIIDSRWPRPDRDSGSVDAVLQARTLRDFGYEVLFVGDESFREVSPYRDRLAAEGVICLTPELTPSIQSFLGSDGGSLRLCILSRVYHGGRFLEAVRQHAPRAKIVFNTVDLHHLREDREARLAGNLEGVRLAEMTREREYYLARQADATIVVSSVERAALLRDVPGAAVFEMPLARPVRRADTIPGFAKRKGVGFVGGFEHVPNVDAVRYLFNEIWPHVLQRLPDATLEIVGADLPQDLRSQMPAGVRYLGPLPDLDPWFDGLRMTVAPLRYGAGAKGKVASSLAAGVPCVATPIAAEGMRLRDGQDVAICDTPEAFAARICELHEDPALWAKLSAGGHARAQAEFSVGAGTRRLADMLHTLDLPAAAPADGTPA